MSKATALLTSLQKRFGDDKVMMANDIPVGRPISTGSLALDFATTYSGFPSNRVVEICGREGVGKSSLGLLTMLNALDKFPDRVAIFLDLEHKITPDWLETIVGKGRLENDVFYLQPDSIEQATNMYRAAVGTGSVCCAILDSIGGAPTVRRNDDAEVGHYGGNAVGVGEFARTAATMSSIHECLTIGINQTRADMGGYNALTLPGGRAWGHAQVMRIELVRGRDTETAVIDGEKVPVGYTVYAKVRKNQVGPPGRTAMFWFFSVYTPEWGFGVDRLDEIIRLGVKTRVFDQRGGWYYHPALPADVKGEHKVQGLINLRAEVRVDESLRQTLSSEILARLAEHGQEVAPLSEPDAPVEMVESEVLS